MAPKGPDPALRLCGPLERGERDRIRARPAGRVIHKRLSLLAGARGLQLGHADEAAARPAARPEKMQSAAEAGRLARRVQSRHGRAILAEHTAVEIGLQPAQRLARENVEAHRDQRPRIGIEDLVWGCGTDEPVAQIPPRSA
jgi:hypothetical protein